METFFPVHLAGKPVGDAILTAIMYAFALLIMLGAFSYILFSTSAYFEECRIARWKAYIPFYGFYLLLKEHRLHPLFWPWFIIHMLWMPEISNSPNAIRSFSLAQIIWTVLSFLTIGWLTFCIDGDSDLGYLRSAYAALIPWLISLFFIWLSRQAISVFLFV